MISLEQLRNVKSVYYHASCPDGTASAIIISAAFRAWDAPEFHSLQYDTEFMDKLEPRPGQLFVDITPPKTRWEEWREHEPIVLDHHETVEAVTKGLGGVYATNEAHSGAMLAFENVMLPIAESGDGSFTSFELERWRHFATVAMVRDTWKKSHALWRESGAQALALQFHGSKPLIEASRTQAFGFSEVLKWGELLLKNNERKTELIAGSAMHGEVSDGSKTFKVSFFNCTENIISDVGNALIERGSDVAVGYFYLFEDGQQKLSVSIRTNGSLSARIIAQTFGGGGHNQAAGFRIPAANTVPPGILLAYIEQGVKSQVGL